MKLRLFDKGLLLVATPLLAVMVLLIAMSGLVGDLDKQARRLDHLKSVFAEVQLVERQFYVATHTLSMYATSGKEHWLRLYAESVWRIRELGNSTSRAMAKDKKYQKSFARVQLLAALALESLADTADHIANTRDSVFSLTTEMPLASLAAVLSELSVQTHAFIEDMQSHESVSPQQEEQLRAKVHMGLTAGIAISACFVALSMLFYRRMTGRLNVLMENTVRLPKGSELLPAVPGNDEISHLDQVFHEMAIALDKAARHERAITDNAVDVICSIDTDGNFKKINPASQSLFGYEQSELYGKPISQVLAADECARTMETLAKARQHGGNVFFETTITKGGGATGFALWTVHWSQAEQSWFCVVHDITERKHIERLRQEFVAMVSHDLRTPLTSLLVYFGLMTEGVYGSLSDKGNEVTLKARGTTTRLIELINDILDLEKMEAGKLEMSFTNCDVQSIIESCMDSVRGIAEQKKVQLEVRPINMVFYGDEARMVQVLVNLCGNAIKYSPAGGTVTIAAEVIGEELEMQVIDRGPGIPPEHCQSIFDRFEQVEQSKSRQDASTGLGLAISKAIVDGHHGTIGVRSKLGEGSTFWLRIPLRQPQTGSKTSAAC